MWCNGEFWALSGHSRKIPFADTAFSLLTGIASISSCILYGPRISTLILFYVYRSSWVVDLEAINHLKATIVKLLLCIKIRTFVCFSNDEKKGNSTLSVTVLQFSLQCIVYLLCIWAVSCLDVQMVQFCSK